mgnify:CR=1 FL=1
MFHHKSPLITAIVAGMSLPLAASALTPEKNVDEELTVTGTKIPKSVTELTHSVTVINEYEIERQGFNDVTEILRQQAGVEFKQAGGVGQFNYLKMRGLAAANVLVVLDGVKINKPSRGDTGNLLSQLDPDNIESVEILRGPQATLYGANSSAGVIVINTKTGSDQSAKVGVEFGSMDWRKATASLRNSAEFANGKWLYALNVSDTSSDNTHKYEYFEDSTLQLKTRYETERFQLGLSIFDADNAFGYAELDETYAALSTRAEHWAYQTPDPDQHSDTTETVYSVFVEHNINDQLSQKLQVSHAENTYAIHDLDNGLLGTQAATVDGIVAGAVTGDRLYIYDRRYPGIELAPLDLTNPANAISDTHAYYEDKSDQVDYTLLLTKAHYSLLAGLEYNDQSAKQWGSYGSADNEDSQISYYINGDLKLLDQQLVLSLGLRTDDYESWGIETTGNLGFSWQLTEATSLYGNVGSSFKPATMSQLFNPSYGDASLSPESGRTVELGLRQRALDDRLTLEATFWNTHIDDVIFFDYSIPNTRRSSGFGQYNNGAKAETSGLELKFAYRLSDTLSLDGNYTYTDSRNKAVSGDWKRTVQVARNKGNVGLNYQSGDLSFGLNAYHAGPRLRWKGDVEMKEYVRLDLSGHYALNEQLSVSLRVENLLDEDIEEGLGYREPGRYALFGIDYKLF